MHLPKSWKDVGSVKDAFIPKRRGKDGQRRERRPKTKKAKKGAKKNRARGEPHRVRNAWTKAIQPRRFRTEDDPMRKLRLGAAL
ncbi:zinc finger protein 585a [Colletotrichum graminicola]|nr:zinc finger protein 585a [Colletotrichum graminicola]